MKDDQSCISATVWKRYNVFVLLQPSCAMGRWLMLAIPVEETAGSLASKMVGAEIEGIEHKFAGDLGDVILELDGLSMPSTHPFAVSLKDISLKVHAGEVVGIAGIAGNGQGELFGAISGEDTQSSPSIVQINGTPSGLDGISARRKLGAALFQKNVLGMAPCQLCH